LSTIYDMVAFTAAPPTPVVDGPRPALPGDVAEVVALVDAAMRAGTDQSMLTDYPLVYAADNLVNVRVLRVDGELVSVVPVIPRAAVLQGRPVRIGIISPTATAPAHQHRGYGSRCLASAIEAMADAGCALSVLWTLVETFPFYEHAGYHPVVFPGVAYALRSRDASLFPADAQVAVSALDPADQRTLAAVRTLHDADAAGEGIRRDAREARALFALPKVRTLVGRRHGEVAGYLVVSGALNKPGLIEAGGDAATIETLVQTALLGVGDGVTVDAHALRVPTAFGAVLDRRVPERRRVVEAAIMVRVNDAAAVLGRVPPIALDRAMWAAALFGNHPARPADVPAALEAALGVPLPLDLPIPVLDRS
jgi:GNAT superfamily N-acetyltransferase